jgi:hypothetical protein
VFSSCLLATDLNTETSTSNDYEVFLPFLVSSTWNLGNLTRGWVCRIQLLLAPARAFILRSERSRTLDHIFSSEILDSPNLDTRSLYLYPPGTGWCSYIPGTVLPFRRLLRPPQPGGPVCYALMQKFEADRIRKTPLPSVPPLLRSYSLAHRHELAESSLMLRPTVRGPVLPGRKHPSGAQDQTSTNVRQPRAHRCGTPPSPTRERVCRPQPLPSSPAQ